MSVIASKWAYSQSISNPVAKNILAFLASHNFPGNKTFFSVQTIAGATAYSRRAVIENLKWLVHNKYLIKETRIAQDGGQQSNIYVLNISEDYVEDFCADYKKLSTPPVQEVHPPRAGGAPPPVQEVHPNNNILNNNLNKSSCNDKPKKSKDEWRKENEKKHAFAESKNQMACENKNIQENEQHKRALMPDSLREIIKNMKLTGEMRS